MNRYDTTPTFTRTFIAISSSDTYDGLLCDVTYSAIVKYLPSNLASSVWTYLGLSSTLILLLLLSYCNVMCCFGWDGFLIIFSFTDLSIGLRIMKRFISFIEVCLIMNTLSRFLGYSKQISILLMFISSLYLNSKVCKNGLLSLTSFGPIWSP